MFVSYNTRLYPADTPLFSGNNRSFRYGDGFFETMKLVNGQVSLGDLHWERLFTSLDLLRFKCPAHFTPAFIRGEIETLALRNGHQSLARVRLSISRGDGGLYEFAGHKPNLLIQTWPLDPETQKLNTNGLDIGVYTDARKTCDAFSHIKSNNYLAYVMAAIWAKEQKLNDALLLNSFHRIADATIANLFVVKDGVVRTPALGEGCVAGVMRRYLLQCLRKAGIPVYETQVERAELEEASELFLTNSMTGIRWVKQMDGISYGNALSSLLYRDYMAPLWSGSSWFAAKDQTNENTGGDPVLE